MPHPETSVPKMSPEEYEAAMIEVKNRISPDLPISPYIVTLTQQDIDFLTQATTGFIDAASTIGEEYTQHISDGEENHPIVDMLEHNAPPELRPILRQEVPRLDFTRLDFHGARGSDKKIIEYNSSPGFAVLGSVVNQVLAELGYGDANGLEDASQFARSAGQLVLEKALLPLAEGSKQPTIAFFDRLGDREVNIHGELEHLQGLAIAQGVNIIFPSSSEDFKYERGRLIHKPTGVTVDGVHMSASEGGNFERWNTLVDSPVFRAYLDNAVNLWPRPSNALLTSKMLIAWLSEHRPADDTPGAKELKEALVYARALTDETKEDAKRRVADGEKIVIKPFNGSGSRGVEVLKPGNRRVNNIINRIARDEGSMYMEFAPAPMINGSLAHTSDVVVFLDKSGVVDPASLLFTSRVFEGEKVNTKSVDGGTASVMKIPS